MSNEERYRETHIMTASPMELVLMLYDQCISALNQVEEAFQVAEPERFQLINNHLLHAQDIITELSVSLDFEKGGEVASNLQNLYEFMVHHLSQANVTKSPDPVREVKGMLEDLREAWREVAKQEVSGGTPPPSPGSIQFSG